MRDSNENILRTTQTEWLNVWFVFLCHFMCSEVEKDGEKCADEHNLILHFGHLICFRMAANPNVCVQQTNKRKSCMYSFVCEMMMVWPMCWTFVVTQSFCLTLAIDESLRNQTKSIQCLVHFPRYLFSSISHLTLV